MTRREEHDADHDKRHGDGEQDQSEGADAADSSCRLYSQGSLAWRAGSLEGREVRCTGYE